MIEFLPQVALWAVGLSPSLIGLCTLWLESRERDRASDGQTPDNRSKQ